MCGDITDLEAVRLRETVLKLVYLNEWDLYLTAFPMEKFREGLRQSRRLSDLMLWMMNETPVVCGTPPPHGCSRS